MIRIWQIKGHKIFSKKSMEPYNDGWKYYDTSHANYTTFHAISCTDNQRPKMGMQLFICAPHRGCLEGFCMDGFWFIMFKACKPTFFQSIFSLKRLSVNPGNGGPRISQTERPILKGGAPTYYFDHFIPTTAWNWKKIGLRGGRSSLVTPLDPRIVLLSRLR